MNAGFDIPSDAIMNILDKRCIKSKKKSASGICIIEAGTSQALTKVVELLEGVKFNKNIKQEINGGVPGQ